MSRIVVAGGVGFLGSHLCRKLLGRGDEVVAVDNFVTGSADNVSDLLDRPGFEVLNRDVIDGVDVDGPLDAVMNLASPASPKEFATLPGQIVETGSARTHGLIAPAAGKGA